MKDCRLHVTVENDRIDIQMERMSVVELATITGFLQNFVGVEAYKRGKSLDDIKDNLLDIHLAAMDSISAEIRKIEDDKNG